MYIGVSIDPERRWNQHKTKNTSCSALKDAITKYGVEKFTFTLLCCGEDSYIDDLEVKAIQLYNTQVPNGYNITLGGDGSVLVYWDDDWNKLLGTKTDKALGEDLGVSMDIISSRRKGLGIPSFAESNRIKWEHIDPLLGTKPDYAIAEDFNISSTSVNNRRRFLGIEIFKEDVSSLFPEEAIKLLGVESDSSISKHYDIPLSAVQNKRKELGIDSVIHGSWVKPRKWSDYELSKIKDTSLTTKCLAALLNLSRTTVQDKRKELGVKYDRFNKRNKYPMTDELISELLDETITYRYFKEKYGMASCTVTRKREKAKRLYNDN